MAPPQGTCGRGLPCKCTWCLGGVQFLLQSPQAAVCTVRRGSTPQGASVSVPLALLPLGGAGRPLSCTPTVPLLPGNSFLAFRLSREPVWTACSTMGLLPTGMDGKPAPELGREGRLTTEKRRKLPGPRRHFCSSRRRGNHPEGVYPTQSKPPQQAAPLRLAPAARPAQPGS